MVKTSLKGSSQFVSPRESESSQPIGVYAVRFIFIASTRCRHIISLSPAVGSVKMQQDAVRKRQKTEEIRLQPPDSATTGPSLKDAAEALPRDTILHEILPRFNPYKLRDLQHVLTLREVYVDTDGGRVRLISDDDLKECYFEKAWGFRKDEWGRDKFVLANWREISVGEMKRKVRDAQPLFYPPGKVDVDTLETKEEIVRAFWELKYLPADVYMTAVSGAQVLRSVKAGDVGEDPIVVGEYLLWACRAGLDLSVIRGLAEKCEKWYIDTAARRAAMGGHTDVLDLLASEFGAEIGVDCLIQAAELGHDAMIDHLVEEYWVDPNGVDGVGWTVLQKAVICDRVRTVKHLVEKHKVDIQKMTGGGRTVLDWAQRWSMTECVSYLREVGAKNGERSVWTTDEDM